MVRIADEMIERIKREVSLVKLVEMANVKLQKQGADFVGCCPFHNDKTPSLVVSPEKNLWHCLGACHKGGSVIDWIMNEKGLDFRAAAELLAEEYFPADKLTDTQLNVNSLLLKRVVDLYHKALKNSREGLHYLMKRSLYHGELIDTFQLGFAGDDFHKTFAAESEVSKQLQQIGIVRVSGKHHLQGCLTVPIFCADGSVGEIYGRKIDTKETQGKHYYLPGTHRGVFNLPAFKAYDEIILCESIIDAMSFWVAGLRHVTSSFGSDGLTEEMIVAMQEHGIRKVFFAYDNDEAGNRGARKAADKLLALGIECYQIELPEEQDGNGLLLEQGPEALVAAAATTISMGIAASAAISLAVGENSAASLEGIEMKDHELIINLADRRYRVRGFKRNMSYEQLRINLFVQMGLRQHVDMVDMYASKQRYGFIKTAAKELNVPEEIIKSDLGQLLLKLEQLQDLQIKQALTPQKKEIVLSPKEQTEALEFLMQKDLVQQILADFQLCGVVGEEYNKLMGYLACVSRKLEKPLAIIIQSSSAAGKSSLMDAVLSFMPPEEKTTYSAMTGQSLFYMGSSDLKHKILAIAEEEGVEHASYALKLLQSEGELTIASTGKDASTGKLATHEYRVEGPVMLFLTTTAIEIDEELMNRCIILTVNESREQTEAIHDIQRQRQTLEGLLESTKKNHRLDLHRNAQRLLRPLHVVNPYAKELTFLSDRTRTRRDHIKYLGLIQTIALLHQYQRPSKSVVQSSKTIEYIEVTVEDIALANDLAHEVLGRTLDELPAPTRCLLMLIKQMVDKRCQVNSMQQKEYRFTRRDVREATNWSDPSLKRHLQRLHEMEYLLIHRAVRGQSFAYELLYDGKGEEKRKEMMGLININKLEQAKDAVTSDDRTSA